MEGGKDRIFTNHSIEELWNEINILKNSLSGGYSLFFFNDASSDIAGYKQLKTVRSAGAVQKIDTLISVADTEIEQWATEPGIPNKLFIAEGFNSLHIHASKLSGTKNAFIYFKAYKYDGATETLISTSENSVLITSEVEQIINVNAFINFLELINTDRIILKIFVSPSGNGTDPEIRLSYEGTTATRINIPFNLI